MSQGFIHAIIIPLPQIFFGREWEKTGVGFLGGVFPLLRGKNMVSINFQTLKFNFRAAANLRKKRCRVFWPGLRMSRCVRQTLKESTYRLNLWGLWLKLSFFDLPEKFSNEVANLSFMVSAAPPLSKKNSAWKSRCLLLRRWNLRKEYISWHSVNTNFFSVSSESSQSEAIAEAEFTGCSSVFFWGDCMNVWVCLLDL